MPAADGILHASGDGDGQCFGVRERGQRRSVRPAEPVGWKLHQRPRGCGQCPVRVGHTPRPERGRLCSPGACDPPDAAGLADVCAGLLGDDERRVLQSWRGMPPRAACGRRMDVLHQPIRIWPSAPSRIRCGTCSGTASWTRARALPVRAARPRVALAPRSSVSTRMAPAPTRGIGLCDNLWGVRRSPGRVAAGQQVCEPAGVHARNVPARRRAHGHPDDRRAHHPLLPAYPVSLSGMGRVALLVSLAFIGGCGGSSDPMRRQPLSARTRARARAPASA